MLLVQIVAGSQNNNGTERNHWNTLTRLCLSKGLISVSRRLEALATSNIFFFKMFVDIWNMRAVFLHILISPKETQHKYASVCSFLTYFSLFIIVLERVNPMKWCTLTMPTAFLKIIEWFCFFSNECTYKMKRSTIVFIVLSNWKWNSVGSYLVRNWA